MLELDNSTNWDLAIFQIIVYVIVFPPAVLVLFRHGLRNHIGWLFLCAFFIMQIVGAGLTISAGKNGISTTGAIISSVGTTAITLAIKGVISEIYREEGEDWIFIRLPAAVAFHVLLVAAAALLATGFSGRYSPDPSSSSGGEIKGGATIYILAWVFLAFLTIRSLFRLDIFKNTRMLLFAAAFSVPLLALRVSFTAVMAFDPSNHNFNPIVGSTAARVLMEILPVMFAAISLIAAGLATMSAVSNNKSLPSEARRPETEIA